MISSFNILSLSLLMLSCHQCLHIVAAPTAAPAPSLAPEPPQQSSPSNCTLPRPFSDATRPFCFVPSTASQQARDFLSSAASAAPNSFGGGKPENTSDICISVLWQFVYKYSINGSDAAKQDLLQDTGNDSIAGVPVVFGTPKGVNASSSLGDARLLVYLHGGGYVAGSCYSQWSTVAPTAAAAAGLPILCIEYRLAPENPFPAGLNDVLSVYKELLNRGYKASNMVLLGDSAGGGLVPAVTIQLQREGVALPAALGMFSPLAELGRQLDTAATLAGVDPILPGAFSDSNGTAAYDMSIRYVGGDVSLFRDPLASPLRADYAALFPAGQLPPVLIQVGLREILLSDAVLLYHKMKQAAPGPGHVMISPYDAMWHVFQSYNQLPEAQAAAKEMGAFFVAALNGKVCPA